MSASTKELSLKDYVYAGYPGIVYKTSEEERALEECYKISEILECRMFFWSLTKGICEIVKDGDDIKTEVIETEVSGDEEALNKGLTLIDGKDDEDKKIIYCLLDFHPFIKSSLVWRTAKDVLHEAKKIGVTYVFISTTFEVPSELEHEVIVHNMNLPKKEDFKELLQYLKEENDMNEVTDEEIEKASMAALGLTLLEAENAFATAISKTGKFDLSTINSVKQQIICKDGLLECQPAEETLETVGGMKNFTEYAAERFSAYSKEAQEYGLPYPKGVLLVGIPGCGKSLASKALANMWNVPLVKLDLGKLFGSYVGDTESNTRRALQIAESMAPCVLWLDEIDKGLSGVNGTGDSGVTARMFGTILTWLQEKKDPVYVIATANNISSLPQELLRKGRFDEIFFVDLPHLEERKEIFEIQIKKHNRKPEDFDVEKLAQESDGYNGAEIEECVVDAMFRAWNDGKRAYSTEDIEEAMKKIKPASEGIMGETVKKLREWSENNSIRKANSVVTVENGVLSKASKKRVIKSQA